MQHDALQADGVEQDNIYEDRASCSRDDRPGLTGCLKSLRADDVLVVWKLDRLGRSLTHLVNTMKDLSDRKIGLWMLTGKGAEIDTTTASGRMITDQIRGAITLPRHHSCNAREFLPYQGAGARIEFKRFPPMWLRSKTA